MHEDALIELLAVYALEISRSFPTAKSRTPESAVLVLDLLTQLLKYEQLDEQHCIRSSAHSKMAPLALFGSFESYEEKKSVNKETHDIDTDVVTSGDSRLLTFVLPDDLAAGTRAPHAAARTNEVAHQPLPPEVAAGAAATAQIAAGD